MADVIAEKLYYSTRLSTCFYQDWQSEYSEANDVNVLIRFAQRENLEIVNNLINDLIKKVFESDEFDLDPLLSGYNSEREWFKTAYKTLVSETR